MFERAWMKLVVGLMFAQIIVGGINLVFHGITANTGSLMGFLVGAVVFHDFYKTTSRAKAQTSE